MRFFLPILFVILWSTGYTNAKFVAPFAEPLSILTLRFAGAALLLFLLAVVLRAKWPDAKTSITTMISGIMIHGAYLGGVFWGIEHGMPAGVSALLVALQPILTAILAGPFLGDTIRPRHWLGLLVGLIGCAMVIWPKFTFSAQGITPATLGAHIIAVLGIVCGSLFQKKYVGAMDFRTGPPLQLLGAAIVTLPIALADESFTIDWQPTLIAGYVWMTLILSCITATLYLFLLQNGEATKIATLIYLVPACTAIQGYLFFSELLTPLQLLGTVVTTMAVAIANDVISLRKQKPDKEANQQNG